MQDILNFQNQINAENICVWHAPTNHWQPIPVFSTPLVMTQKEWRKLSADCGLILQVFPKLLSWLQAPHQKKLLYWLIKGLSPLEQMVALDCPRKNWGHATIRFDLFFDKDELKVIETNWTIPAMQAYSDLVSQAYQRSMPMAGLTGFTNTNDLFESLLCHYFGSVQCRQSPTIAIIARAGDSQYRELLHYASQWTRKGCKTIILTPQEIEWIGGHAFWEGQRVDLLYRHIFGWRLESEGGWPDRVARGTNGWLYNPISAHYEVKGFLALISEICRNFELTKKIGISRAEQEAVERRIPETYILWPESLKENAAELKIYNMNVTRQLNSSFSDYVFKSNIGYGGHQVLMGSQWESESNQAKLKKFIPESTVVSPSFFLNWSQAISDGLWIAQKKLTGKTLTGDIIRPDSIERQKSVFLDASIFLNSNCSYFVQGGVSRFATSEIVNIGTGGGLAPIFLSQ